MNRYWCSSAEHWCFSREIFSVFNQQRGKIGIIADKVKCDYYNWCNGNRIGNEYRGEYMMQYSWAEDTNGLLENSK